MKTIYLGCCRTIKNLCFSRLHFKLVNILYAKIFQFSNIFYRFWYHHYLEMEGNISLRLMCLLTVRNRVSKQGTAYKFMKLWDFSTKFSQMLDFLHYVVAPTLEFYITSFIFVQFFSVSIFPMSASEVHPNLKTKSPKPPK